MRNIVIVVFISVLTACQARVSFDRNSENLPPTSPTTPTPTPSAPEVTPAPTPAPTPEEPAAPGRCRKRRNLMKCDNRCFKICQGSFKEVECKRRLNDR